jgi:hypothetical protein
MNIQRLGAMAALLWLAGAAVLRAGPVTAVPPPAAAGAMGASLVVAPDGGVLLSWLEPAGTIAWAAKFSRFDPVRAAWGEPRLIAQGPELFTNWADFPQLAVAPGGRLTAVWFVHNPAHHAAAGADHHGPGYRAIYAHSTDEGKTWTPDLPVSDESLPVEFATLQPLPDGRMLVAWLDGRKHGSASARMKLYARVLDAPGPDGLVDESVCDCCQLSFASVPGGALLAYRGRTDGEIRDILLARFDGQAWTKLGPLHADGWKIPGCPVNGPQLAASGTRVGAVWFTAAGNETRVLARVSADAGKTFGPVARVDLGRPQGRVDSLMLADGTLVMSWLEMTGQEAGKEGGIYLRTLSPAGELSAPRLVAPSKTSRASGFPRIASLGGRHLLLACTQDGDPTRVLAFRIELD